MDINKKIAQELNIRESQVAATIKLIDEGNTIPFIARYRKEVTGSLDDEVLRAIDELRDAGFIRTYQRLRHSGAWSSLLYELTTKN